MFSQPNKLVCCWHYLLLALCELAALSEKMSERESGKNKRDGERERKRDKMLLAVNPLFYFYLTLQSPTVHTHTHTHSYIALLAGALKQPWWSLWCIKVGTCQEKAVVMETEYICSNCRPTCLSARAQFGCCASVCVLWTFVCMCISMHLSDAPKCTGLVFMFLFCFTNVSKVSVLMLIQSSLMVNRQYLLVGYVNMTTLVTKEHRQRNLGPYLLYHG